MENSDIDIYKKPFKLLFLPCHNIIETIPLTIKGLYPVRELSVKLNWIDDSNIMSNGFFTGHKNMANNISPETSTSKSYIKYKMKRLNSSTNSFSTHFYQDEPCTIWISASNIDLKNSGKANFYSVTTFDNHPWIQRVLEIIKEHRGISVELEIINEASFKDEHHCKKLCKYYNNIDQEKINIQYKENAII